MELAQVNSLSKIASGSQIPAEKTDSSLFASLLTYQLSADAETMSNQGFSGSDLETESASEIKEAIDVKLSDVQLETLVSVQNAPELVIEEGQTTLDLSKVLQKFNGLLKDGTKINLWLEAPVDNRVEQPLMDADSVENITINTLDDLIQEASKMSQNNVVTVKEAELKQPIKLENGLSLPEEKKVLLLSIPITEKKMTTVLIVPSENEATVIGEVKPLNVDIDNLTSNQVKQEQVLTKTPINILDGFAKQPTLAIDESSQFVTKEANVTHQRLTQQAFQRDNLKTIEKNIVEVLTTIKNGQTTEFKVTLRPEKLGKINITLQKNEGQITAKFMVGSEQVKEIVEKSLPSLELGLSKQQVSLNRVEVVTTAGVEKNLDFSSSFSQEQHQAFQQFKNTKKGFQNRPYQIEQQVEVKESTIQSNQVDILA